MFRNPKLIDTRNGWQKDSEQKQKNNTHKAKQSDSLNKGCLPNPSSPNRREVVSVTQLPNTYNSG